MVIREIGVIVIMNGGVDAVIYHDFIIISMRRTNGEVNFSSPRMHWRADREAVDDQAPAPS